MALILIVEDEKSGYSLKASYKSAVTKRFQLVQQALALLEGEQKPDLLFTDLGLHGNIVAGLQRRALSRREEAPQFLRARRGSASQAPGYSYSGRAACTRPAIFERPRPP